MIRGSTQSLVWRSAKTRLGAKKIEKHASGTDMGSVGGAPGGAEGRSPEGPLVDGLSVTGALRSQGGAGGRTSATILPPSACPSRARGRAPVRPAPPGGGAELIRAGASPDLRSRGLDAFGGEQRFLASEPPPVSRGCSVGPDDAVARDDDRNGVGRAGARDRACSAGGADCVCDLRVCPRFAERNPAERIPDAALEGGGADIERQRCQIGDRFASE